MKNVLFIFSVLLSLGLEARELSINDLSILSPLPKNEIELNQMISLDDRKYLPENYLNLLPNSLFIAISTAYTISNMKLIALRIDPCFRVNNLCQPQIRLIWQEIGYAESYGVPMPRLGLESKDVALHTFYNISDSDFVDIKNLFASNDSSLSENYYDQLQVNPILNNERFNGKYYKLISNMLLKYCNRNSLWRMTYMKTLPGGDIWEFGGFNINNENSTPIMIPNLNAQKEVFKISLAVMDLDRYSGGEISPKLNSEYVLLNFLQDSNSFKRNSVERQDVIKLVSEINNPKLRSPENTDCVSCHVANSAENILNNTGEMKKPNSLRAFGYLGIKSVISHRIQAEAKEIMEKI